MIYENDNVDIKATLRDLEDQFGELKDSLYAIMAIMQDHGLVKYDNRRSVTLEGFSRWISTHENPTSTVDHI